MIKNYESKAKIKQIGGNPNEISADAKDVLVWIKCQVNKDHPSYLITPYEFTHGKRCPLCEGRDVLKVKKMNYRNWSTFREKAEQLNI
jgi:hypothetical protein